MSDTQDPYTVPLELDLSAFSREMKSADQLARNFGSTMDRALTNSIVRGKGFTDVLKGMVLQMSALTLKSAFAPITSGLGESLSGILGEISPFAKGGVTSQSVVPFAAGGVVRTPSFFPMSSGRMGLMGEAGAEAIMPLARGSDGRLGVASNGGAGGKGVQVNVTIQARDVESFRQSRNDIAATLSRALSRGQRSL